MFSKPSLLNVSNNDDLSLNVVQVRAELEQERRVRVQDALEEAERRCFFVSKDLERCQAERETTVKEAATAKDK